MLVDYPFCCEYPLGYFLFPRKMIKEPIQMVDKVKRQMDIRE
jgi:hypothetical protein